MGKGTQTKILRTTTSPFEVERNQKSILETPPPSEREMERERKRVETLPLNPKGKGKREKARRFKPPPPQSKREVRGIRGRGKILRTTTSSFEVERNKHKQFRNLTPIRKGNGQGKEKG